MKDVEKFRNSKEIIRFREVLTTWINCLHEGDVQSEKKIRKDIKKANIELKRLEKWKKFNRSPINFWINSIGGHIPVFSNVLTLIYMMSGFYEKRIETKYNWILMNK